MVPVSGIGSMYLLGKWRKNGSSLKKALTERVGEEVDRFISGEGFLYPLENP